MSTRAGITVCIMVFCLCITAACARASTMTMTGVIVQRAVAGERNSFDVWDDFYAHKGTRTPYAPADEYLFCVSGRAYPFTNEGTMKVRQFLKTEAHSFEIKAVISKGDDEVLDIIYIDNIH